MTINKLIVMRHYLSGGNKRNIVQGQSNTELQRGYKAQAERLTNTIVRREQLIPQVAPVYVFCSNSDRAFYTAQWVNNHLANEHHVQADLRRTELLKERGQGVLEELPYEQAIPILRQFLPPGTSLSPNASSIYPYLFSLDVVPQAEKLESAASRLERFVMEDVQRLEGTGLIVGHGISIMNYLINLLRYGNILGEGTYQHFPNMGGVRLERESFGRYRETGRYEPPYENGNPNNDNSTLTLDRIVVSP